MTFSPLVLLAIALGLCAVGLATYAILDTLALAREKGPRL